ncbi:CBS domain-containing protein [Thermoproteus tenax]|uniref:CBS domain n=1 Tax=Thermoproteus tenax (strain ATCC 35583 / DSM 2078 / JCM 9277 / NBRC 100435 / Kra 1) TaxID=768679 RepID=G4RJK6_THETK|nr:CBS domain-containing protein [Thermoproteus tenax]CCC81751.1 CBS domain [Thermoproteus tenax Kra 1]
MSLGQFVKRSPLTARPETPLREIVRLMAENNVGSVVLVDDANKPVGIITERDVVKALARGLTLDDQASRAGTMGDLVTAQPSEDAYVALKRMRERRIRHLVLVNNDGTLAGVISIRDLLEDVALKYLGDKVWWPPPED